MGREFRESELLEIWRIGPEMERNEQDLFRVRPTSRLTAVFFVDDIYGNGQRYTMHYKAGYLLKGKTKTCGLVR